MKSNPMRRARKRPQSNSRVIRRSFGPSEKGKRSVKRKPLFRKIIMGILVGFVATVIGVGLSLSGLLEGFEYQLWDLRHRCFRSFRRIAFLKQYRWRLYRMAFFNTIPSIRSREFGELSATLWRTVYGLSESRFSHPPSC